MLTFADIAKVRKVKNLLGVEVEVEGVNLCEIEGWIFTNDGSLRGESAEYVLPRPSSYKETEEGLTTLEEKLNDRSVPSHRTSVHIHINITDMKPEHVLNFICLYYLVEPSLLAWCGENRTGNMFCLGVKDAEYPLQALKDAVNCNNLQNINSGKLRYAALNLKALLTYGSLEFRSLRGVVDKDTIQKWIDCLLTLRTFAQQFNTPIQVLNYCTTENVFNSILDIEVEDVSSQWNLIAPYFFNMDYVGLTFLDEPLNDV